MQYNNFEISLKKNEGFSWFVRDGNSVKGYFFDDKKRLYVGESLFDYFSETETEETFRSKLLSINGFFSIILRNGRRVFAAVDRLRTFPIFFVQSSNFVVISDESLWLQQRCNVNRWQTVSVTEFALTGYVTGSDTLCEGIRQLKAGTYLSCDLENNSFKLVKYFSLKHDDFFQLKRDVLIEKLHKVYVDVFERLIASALGRTFIIPLSGGYDSRLIAIMLKLLHYENVVCFSYGALGNQQSKISKKLAEHLGYKWYFVPYSRQQWAKLFRSEERKAYYRYAHNLSTIPHMQDWPAVWALKKDQIIPKDSIFVPGHSGDFLAGSHIPQWFTKVKEVSSNQLFREIYAGHYNLRKWHKDSAQYEPIFQDKILQLIDCPDAMSPELAADAFECWDWQERQAKFICNSVRVYEFWGFAWRLPLWDNEVIDFWSRITLKDRVERNFFLAYVAMKQNIPQICANPIPMYTTRQVIQKTVPLLFCILKIIKKQIRRIVAYYQGPIKWHGIANYSNYLYFVLTGSSPSIYALQTRLYLESIGFKNPFKEKTSINKLTEE